MVHLIEKNKILKIIFENLVDDRWCVVWLFVYIISW